MKKKLALILAAVLLLTTFASAAPVSQLSVMLLQTAPTAISQLLSRAIPDRGTEIVRTETAAIYYTLSDDGSAVITSVRLSDGKTVQTMTVSMDDFRDDDARQELGAAAWAEVFGRTVCGSDNSAFWGEIGCYRYSADGTFTQVTDRAVLSWADGGDGSILAISHEPGKRTYYDGAGMAYNPAGDEVLRVQADGTVETLLSDTPRHGLSLTAVTGFEGDTVRVCHTYIMGMADVHSYEYAVENGKLRALENTPGAGFSGYTAEEAVAEQARLDSLGCGVGSK